MGFSVKDFFFLCRVLKALTHVFYSKYFLLFLVSSVILEFNVFFIGGANCYAVLTVIEFDIGNFNHVPGTGKYSKNQKFRQILEVTNQL